MLPHPASGGSKPKALGHNRFRYSTRGEADAGIQSGLCYIGGKSTGGKILMERQGISRRALLRSTLEALPRSAILLGMPAVLAACSRAVQNQLDGIGLQLLGGAEAEEFAAIADRIIPPDETPGAREAGVVHFMDTVLADQRERELQLLRDGLGELRQRADQVGATAGFSSLDAGAQDELLREIENTEFFATVRYLTVAGMFALSRYGGNRDNIGWRLIGFERRPVWQPPFGHYDEDYMNQGGR